MEGNNNNSGLVTEKQLKYIGFLRGKTGTEKFKETIKKIGLKEDLVLKELTSEEASILIDELQKLVPQNGSNKPKNKFVRFSDLLKKATKKYPDLSIKTEWLNRGEGEIAYKHPVFKAIITTKDKTIEATGDIEISKDDTKFPIRKAESVTISRALRFLFGEDVTDIEMEKD